MVNLSKAAWYWCNCYGGYIPIVNINRIDACEMGINGPNWWRFCGKDTLSKYFNYIGYR